MITPNSTPESALCLLCNGSLLPSLWPADGSASICSYTICNYVKMNTKILWNIMMYRIAAGTLREQFACLILKFNARHSDVFLTIIIYDIMGSQTQQFIILYHFRATCFDSLESSSGPPLNLTKTI
jgi:hypothetical protein